MTKNKALVLGILMAISAGSLLVDNFNPCMWPFVLGAALCFSLWFSKYQRDHQIIERAKAIQILPEAPSESEGHEEYARLLAGDMALGYDPETGKVLYVSKVDRYSGTYIIGVQGSGKSALIQDMIAQEVAGGE